MRIPNYIMNTFKKWLIVLIAIGLAIFGWCQYHEKEQLKDQIQNETGR